MAIVKTKQKMNKYNKTNRLTDIGKQIKPVLSRWKKNWGRGKIRVEDFFLTFFNIFIGV